MMTDGHGTASSGGDGVVAAHAAEANRLLRALPTADYEWLLVRLTPVRLRYKQTLFEPDASMPYVYFPRDGVGSVIAVEQEGGDVEVGTIGNEGFIGLPVLLGDDASANRVDIQVEGEGWRLGADVFRQLVEERPTVRRLFLRYAAYYLEQVSQSVACNRLHTLEERCARWILMTHDRVHENPFDLTHEYLSVMLGVRRAGVTVAIGTLQSAGIVRSTRGRVEVLDRERLEEASCGCYRINRVALDRLFRALGG
jgi:CRP-like cAMP-binding protein